MTYLGVQTTSYQVENLSWKASGFGDEYHPGVTLDISKFTAGTHYPNGYIPSGCVLGKVTATGMYGPYNDAAVDGTNTARGLLIASCRVTQANGVAATRVSSGLLIRGDVIEANLPFSGATFGAIDAAGKVDLTASGCLVRFE
jgi:hypothetical protein